MTFEWILIEKDLELLRLFKKCMLKQSVGGCRQFAIILVSGNFHLSSKLSTDFSNLDFVPKHTLSALLDGSSIF